MTWTEVSGPGSASWAGTAVSTTTWEDNTRSDTTGRNASRFIQAAPFDDAEGGVDFNETVGNQNPWIVTDIDPITLTDTDRNEPA